MRVCASTNSNGHMTDKPEVIVQHAAIYQLKSARTSLNIMFQEWANRGLHYWEIANNNITKQIIKK